MSVLDVGQGIFDRYGPGQVAVGVGIFVFFGIDFGKQVQQGNQFLVVVAEVGLLFRLLQGLQCRVGAVELQVYLSQQPVGIDEEGTLPFLALVFLHLLYDFQSQQRFVAIEIDRGNALLHEHNHVFVLLGIELVYGQEGVFQGLVVILLFGVGDSQVVVVDKQFLLVFMSLVELYRLVEKGIGLSILFLMLKRAAQVVVDDGRHIVHAILLGLFEGVEVDVDGRGRHAQRLIGRSLDKSQIDDGLLLVEPVGKVLLQEAPGQFGVFDGGVVKSALTELDRHVVQGGYRSRVGERCRLQQVCC